MHVIIPNKIINSTEHILLRKRSSRRNCPPATGRGTSLPYSKGPLLFPAVNQVSPVRMVTPYFIVAYCYFIPPCFIYDIHLPSLSELTLEVPLVALCITCCTLINLLSAQFMYVSCNKLRFFSVHSSNQLVFLWQHTLFSLRKELKFYT
jgi:hypothetical protein